MDLGFRHQALTSGEVAIRRGDRTVTVLRGEAAADFLRQITATSFEEGQQAMARITGNYRRGNERVAARHPRNR